MINTPGWHENNNADCPEKVAASLKKYSLLQGGEAVLIGISGGPDSVCLLHVLHRLKEEFRLTLHSVYVNHNLRPEETEKEIAFCRQISGKLGVECTIKSVDVKSYADNRKISTQEASRELRYQAFHETALDIRADRIAVAHNADDQLETFFMRILRGSGPRGLSGIPVKRGKIIRPLLEVSRNDIERFLAREHIPFVVDSSNLRQDYHRNRIRNALMPVLKEFNPNLRETVLHTIAIIQEEERYFDVIVTKTLMKLISRKTEKRIELFLAPMEAMDIVILRRTLRRALDETKGLRGIGFGHVEDIVHLIKDGESGDRLYLPGEIRVIREYSLLVITADPPARIMEYELEPDAVLFVREAGLVIKATTGKKTGGHENRASSVLLDAGKMQFPLKVRRRVAGDYFFPLGFGRRKKLQDFFVDAKVPRDERDSVPIVLSGDDIVWIAGFRADERFRVSDETVKTIQLTVVKGKK